MEAAGTAHTAQRKRDQAAQDSTAEAPWRERALNAEDALKAAHDEIRAQRTRIGRLLGQLRDAEREFTQDAIQRMTTENTTLKQRVRQLAATTASSQSGWRPRAPTTGSPDRRIAQLEAQLAEPQHQAPQAGTAAAVPE
jgi:hypothetical protein